MGNELRSSDGASHQPETGLAHMFSGEDDPPIGPEALKT